jgi:alanine racemase
MGRGLYNDRCGVPSSTVTVDLRQLDRNAQVLRSIVPRSTKFCAVVKNNAFGHGVGPVARSVARHVDMFGVVDNWEAHEIRGMGISHPILRVRCASPAEVMEAPPGVEEPIGSLEGARFASEIGAKLGRPINVHLFVNIGENRMSFNLPGEMEDLMAGSLLPYVNVVGIMAHFAVASDLTLSRAHLAHFIRMADTVEQALSKAKGASVKLTRHVANTQATLTFPESRLDMVRIGGGIFGQEDNIKPLHLRPAFTWTTHVSVVRRVPKGSSLGYGMAYQVREDKVVASLPIGYGNGLRKVLSSSVDEWATHGEVVVHGVRCPIVGRISSSITTVDVTHVSAISGRPVRMGDTVTIMGTDPQEPTAEDVARRLDTSFDDITSSVVGAKIEYVLPQLEDCTNGMCSA